MYRICKRFEFQAAHVLSKHPGRCRFVHGHSYIVEVRLVADQLDENDMVCDFQALKAVVQTYLDGLDHSMLLNSADQANCARHADNPRKVAFDNCDPSSEVLAREIFMHTQRCLRAGPVENSNGVRYTLNPHARVQAVRVWETSTAWAEYRQ